MNDELEPEDDLTDEDLSLTCIFDKEPDYRAWASMSGPVPLKDAICYAVGLPLNFKEMPPPKNSWVDLQQ